MSRRTLPGKDTTTMDTAKWIQPGGCDVILIDGGQPTERVIVTKADPFALASPELVAEWRTGIHHVIFGLLGECLSGFELAPLNPAVPPVALGPEPDGEPTERVGIDDRDRRPAGAQLADGDQGADRGDSRPTE